MKNPGDKVVSQRIIDRWQRCFAILDGWDIKYAEDKKKLKGRKHVTNGQVHIDVKGKRADIYPCPKGISIGRYVMHEMIHVALKAAGIKHKFNESLTQDLCLLICTGVQQVVIVSTLSKKDRQRVSDGVLL